MPITFGKKLTSYLLAVPLLVIAVACGGGSGIEPTADIDAQVSAAIAATQEADSRISATVSAGILATTEAEARIQATVEARVEATAAVDAA